MTFADAPDTAALVVGGTPGTPFAVSPWEARQLELGRRAQPPPAQSGISPSPLKSAAASAIDVSAGGTMTSDDSMSLSPTRWPSLRMTSSISSNAAWNASSSSVSTAAHNGVVERVDALDALRVGRRYWPSPMILTITAWVLAGLELGGGGGAALAQLGLHLCELVVDHAAGAERRELAVDVVRAGAELREILERAGRLELLDRRGARLHVLGLVDRALHREADVGHLLADAGRRLGDAHLRLGGGVLRLDDLLLRPEGLDLRSQPLLGLGQLLLLALQLGDLLVERLQLGLRKLLALERGPRQLLVPAASAWRACVSSLTTDCSSFSACMPRRFFAVTTSAMPFLTPCSDSSCFW